CARDKGYSAVRRFDVW
nr:immunoglobulin heavy chain junction region [Macaca mulatta]MOX60163.1 immunoglobulin heavy chain junction region [Macaca mulatta]MOX60682.1 immunoglobulin heavy chain junction region [Macaca mulatta]MOX61168.1 immunoglobulin heavy chain junction region [Macaca mulatta]MOX63159.1 immunoglobulin heavy chain junction region [Macaca mulatta]